MIKILSREDDLYLKFLLENDYLSFKDFLSETDNSICHYGIKGMKYYTHKFGKWQKQAQYANGIDDPNKDIRDLMSKNDTSYNIEKFGKTPETNVLYITGLSGSGKSTIAKSISKKENSEYIELDYYYEFVNDERGPKPNKEFDKFLSKNVPEYWSLKNKILKEDLDFYDLISNKHGKYNDEYRTTMDKVVEATKKFGESLFGKRSVIVEGIQLYDDYGPANNYGVLNKSPIIIKNTPLITSMYRRMKRDDVHFNSVSQIIHYGADYISWGIQSNKQIKEMEKEIVKYGEKFIKR